MPAWLEKGQQEILIIRFSSYSYVALLHYLLANVSVPHIRGWGAMAAGWYDHGRHGSPSFHNLQAPALCFKCVFYIRYFHLARGKTCTVLAV
jgi:hypothetical protein